MACVAEREGASASMEEESDVQFHGEQPSSGSGSRESELEEGVTDGEELEYHLQGFSIKQLINFWGINAQGFDDSGTIEERYGDVGRESEFRFVKPRVESPALRLLEDIGSCQTLWALDLEVNELTISEKRAKALFSPVKSNLALRVLNIYGDWDKASKWIVSGLLEVIRCAPRLAKLYLGISGLSDHDKVKALADALLECSPSLEFLHIRRVEEGHKDLLIRAFSGAYHNQTIRGLHLEGKAGLSVYEGLTESLVHVLSTNQSLIHVVVRRSCVEGMSVGQWQKIGHSLLSNTSLQHLSVEISATSVEAGDSVEQGPLEKVRGVLAAANEKRDPIIDIRVAGIAHTSRYGETTLNVWKDILTNFRSLKGVRLLFAPDKSAKIKAALGLEGHNTLLLVVLDVLRNNLSSFQLLHVELSRSPEIWKRIFRALRNNTTVTYLVLRGEGFHASSFRELMGMLEVNFTLRTINYEGTNWEGEGKGPLIDAALQRKAERQSYFAVLRHANLKFKETIARTGRLFLCGGPYSGKTRLRKTMMGIQSKSWLGNKVTELAQADLWRTTGIEVDFLQDDDNMQISMWDLAGQEMFRILQDILFPRAFQPYIFLFVFSTYDEEKKEDKPNPEVLLREELEDWLRFVVSNSHIGYNQPRMIVVVTHRDKVSNPSINWAITIVKELQTEFQGMVDILFEPNFYVNAYKGKHVSPVLNQVLISFKNLFLETRPMIVPLLCSKLISVLAHPTVNIQKNPIWSRDTFYDFCFQKVQNLNWSEGADKPSREVWDATAMYLHDVGSIVLIPESDLVVVYPHWLTHHFLGELVTLGHNFVVNRKAITSHVRKKSFSSKTGHLSEKKLEELLQSIVIKPSTNSSSADHKLEPIETLKLVLVKLDLCYKLIDESHDARYFMPSIIKEGTDPQSSGKALSWETMDNRQHNYFGFRLQCEDQRRTSLSSAFFTRLQIVLRNKVIANSSFTAVVNSARGYSTFYMDGHEILMEESSQSRVVGSHVDVLVKGSGSKKKVEAMKFVMKHIIDEIRAFCASSQGCQGVTLVLGILSTKCVELLIPCEQRDGKQVILAEHLKQQLQRNIEARLEEDEYTDEQSLLNYEHVWEGVLEANLPRYCEFARDLLLESEVESILRAVQEERKERLQNVDEVSDQMRKELTTSESTSETNDVDEVVEFNCIGLSIDSQLFSPSSSAVEHFSISEIQLDQPHQLLLDKIDRMDHKMDDMNVKLARIEKGVESILGSLQQIISVQKKIDSSLITFRSTLDEMIGFSQSSEQARTPKLPYLSTEGVSFLQKVKGVVQIGTPVRLHFMCESMPKPHVVESQKGLELILENENSESLRRLSIISSKMVWYLLKAGLHITVGWGQAVPDLGSFESALPLLIGKAAVDNFQLDEKATVLEKKELWWWLRDMLESELKGNYASRFSLHRVKFTRLENGGYAWLCDKCVEKGIRAGKLDPV